MIAWEPLLVVLGAFVAAQLIIQRGVRDIDLGQVVETRDPAQPATLRGYRWVMAGIIASMPVLMLSAVVLAWLEPGHDLGQELWILAIVSSLACIGQGIWVAVRFPGIAADPERLGKDLVAQVIFEVPVIGALVIFYLAYTRIAG